MSPGSLKHLSAQLQIFSLLSRRQVSLLPLDTPGEEEWFPHSTIGSQLKWHGLSSGPTPAAPGLISTPTGTIWLRLSVCLLIPMRTSSRQKATGKQNVCLWWAVLSLPTWLSGAEIPNLKIHMRKPIGVHGETVNNILWFKHTLKGPRPGSSSSVASECMIWAEEKGVCS